MVRQNATTNQRARQPCCAHGPVVHATRAVRAATGTPQNRFVRLIMKALIIMLIRRLYLLPKVGAAWMPKGSEGAVMALGKHAKYSLAGALKLATGEILHCRSAQKTHA